MKNIRFKLVPVVVCLMVFVIACSNDDETDTQRTEETIAQIESRMRNGTWRITEFIEDTNDETHHFTGYAFTFETGGRLMATNGSNTYEGSWSITQDDDSSDDSGSNSQNDLDFNIFFDLDNDFEELNDDWDIVSHSASRLELIDISGGNGGTDYLTFERN